MIGLDFIQGVTWKTTQDLDVISAGQVTTSARSCLRGGDPDWIDVLDCTVILGNDLVYVACGELLSGYACSIRIPTARAA
jgi:hypothetical protein